MAILALVASAVASAAPGPAAAQPPPLPRADVPGNSRGSDMADAVDPVRAREAAMSRAMDRLSGILSSIDSGTRSLGGSLARVDLAGPQG